jgi:hypothetical protein
LAADGGKVRFGLPNAIHRDRCEAVKSEVEAALSAHFATPLTLQLVVEAADRTTASTTATPADEDGPDEGGPGEDSIGDTPPPVASIEDRLLQAFPGAEEVR